MGIQEAIFFLVSKHWFARIIMCNLNKKLTSNKFSQKDNRSAKHSPSPTPTGSSEEK